VLELIKWLNSIRSSSQETHLKTIERRLPHGITVLHPTQVSAPALTPASQADYSIYLPWRDERLS